MCQSKTCCCAGQPEGPSETTIATRATRTAILDRIETLALNADDVVLVNLAAAFKSVVSPYEEF